MTTAELLARLVAVDSTNPDLVPGGAGEAGVAAALGEHMTALGLEVDAWDAAPGRPNVVGRLAGTGGGRSLMFCGHTDVVGAERGGFAPEIRDGRMHGRGTNDMKGGIVAALAAAERLAADPPAGDVLIACVIDEEWQSLGAQALVERYRADAAVLPEQSDLDVIFAHGGFAWYDVRSRGVEAAGGRPERGRDAIALAGPVLAGIAELDRELALRETAEWGRPSVHASMIRGGRDYPSYPAECVIGVERCIMPGETVAESLAEMAALLDRARAADARFKGECRTVVAREPVLLDRDEPVVRAAIDAAAGVLGRPPVVRSDYGWMDSGLLVEAGIPCVVLGPTGDGLHTADEWVDLESVDQCAEMFVRIARAFCG
jgi:acetylornithine deacetylase/succinyl-diaminopimelate desuccinylase-like protein